MKEPPWKTTIYWSYLGRCSLDPQQILEVVILALRRWVHGAWRREGDASLGMVWFHPVRKLLYFTISFSHLILEHTREYARGQTDTSSKVDLSWLKWIWLPYSSIFCHEMTEKKKKKNWVKQAIKQIAFFWLLVTSAIPNSPIKILVSASARALTCWLLLCRVLLWQGILSSLGQPGKKAHCWLISSYQHPICEKNRRLNLIRNWKAVHKSAEVELIRLTVKKSQGGINLKFSFEVSS